MSGGGSNIYDQSASSLSAADGLTRASANPMASFGMFANPFEDQVVQGSLNDLERTRQMQMNDIGASASAAGAFGGSRHGIAEAETNRGFGDVSGRLASGLRHQGFTDSVNNSFRNADAQRAAGGQLAGISGQQFGVGQAINEQQMRDGLLVQAMNQQLIDAGQHRFQSHVNAPAESLQYPLAAIGGVPHPQTQTTEQNPGLFNYLSLGLGLL